MRLMLALFVVAVMVACGGQAGSAPTEQHSSADGMPTLTGTWDGMREQTYGDGATTHDVLKMVTVDDGVTLRLSNLCPNGDGVVAMARTIEGATWSGAFTCPIALPWCRGGTARFLNGAAEHTAMGSLVVRLRGVVTGCLEEVPASMVIIGRR